MIPIRLRIRETTREILVHPDETIESVKLREFPNEYTRFLHFGREIHDNITVTDAKVLSNDVVMVSVISKEHIRNTAVATDSRSESNLDPCDLLTLLLTAVCFLIWTAAWSIPSVFSLQSVIMLVPLTIAISYAGFVRMTSPSR